MNNKPELWANLLDSAPKGSVLMGGAVVDWVFGVEAKDYDIFHTYKVGMPDVPDHWKYIEMDYNDPVQKVKHEQDYQLDPGGQHGSIGSVYNYDFGGMRIQLIGVHFEDPREQFKKFDHTLTLGSFSENGLFVSSQVFESQHTKIVKYLGEMHDKYAKRSLLRAWRKIMHVDKNDALKWQMIDFVD